MRTYGYCRISTRHQNLQRQIDNISKAYPEAFIVKEIYTGTKVDRPEWKKLYKHIKQEISKQEITLVFDEVSRLSRNASEGYALYEELFGLGVHLVFLKEPHINSDTYRQTLKNQLQITDLEDRDSNDFLQSITAAINRYMLALAKKQIYLSFDTAEKEVKYLHQRTSEGVRQAQLAGKRVGLPKGSKLVTKKSIEMKKLILEKSRAFQGTLTDSDILKITGLSKNTYYKYKNELYASFRN